MENRDRTFAAFAAEVKDSCESHAKRKNYTQNDIDGPNQLGDIIKSLGIGSQHGIGEIIYKAAEFLKTPRRLLLVKIAGWAFVVWKDCDRE